ncbi:MAG: hypothetical protein K9M10_02150 [Candidatus Pacebacteria bacterium]|nr:hypothetical protein [Candidatus Paceibacterota bacterium]MCF7857266.1 hypothetical protein [Candidatus Paceibacterota bacterium]
MSREHSMFYAHVWNESNRDCFDEYIHDTNIKNMLFVRNERGVLDVYYDLDELKTIFDRIVKGIIDNPSILDTVIEDFYTHWKELLPYLNGEKHISSSGDLKSFYTHYMRWWGPMAYIFVIPDREGMPEDLRVKALKVRKETQEYSDEGDRVYLEYITRTLPNLGQIAHLMTPEEAYRGETLSPEEIAEIERRSSGCGLLTIQGNTHFSPTAVTEEMLKEFGIQLASLEVSDTEEIKGASASTGRVQGRVKMVLVKADLAHVAEGDIMITYATSPDYVPAMKKCSGIVTDEGGVVCHAAIVSRELGIPCVVGTKIATQVLKDGDLVEVDADNGVVWVIKRK